MSARSRLEAGRHPDGAGPPGGTPYTVYFPDGESPLGADLEHASSLPHVGDVVEYIDSSLVTRRYIVREVVHTLQAAPLDRPSGPGRSASEGDAPPADHGSPQLRAGLPEVFLVPAKRRARTR